MKRLDLRFFRLSLNQTPTNQYRKCRKSAVGILMPMPLIRMSRIEGDPVHIPLISIPKSRKPCN